MDNTDLTKILETIDSAETIDIETSFLYAKICSIALATNDTSAHINAERIVVHILNRWDSLPD